MSNTVDDLNVQHEAKEIESDDDYEVYFLKPVNEYNIVDKIKEANKELFNDENALDIESQQNRKVSFAANLEEYEPENGINVAELEAKLGIGNIGKDDIERIQIEEKLEIIAEEGTTNEIKFHETTESDCNEKEHPEEQLSAVIKMHDSEEESLNEFEQTQLKSSTNCANGDESLILEEICEEILIMDMKNNDKLENTVTTKSDNSTGSKQRKIFKQITFDCTENDGSDNQSLTNLLISDNENEQNDNDADHQNYNRNESINDTDTDTDDKLLSTNNEYYDDYEEDDKLSIIVASYLPENLSCDKISLTSDKVKNSPSVTKFRKLSFNKRFSFRHKTKSSNAIGSCSNHYNSDNHRFVPPPEVTDLKLHYKICCDFKNDQQNLPKYNGYISEYGLSKEQLIERECKLEKKQQGKQLETLKTSKAELRKMHDNERAFTTWLKNKMRFPINKTRNMFDVKRSFSIRKCSSVGGNILCDDTKQIMNTNKYRSISAKLKKI